MTKSALTHPAARVGAISHTDYANTGLDHVFLTGDLQKPAPHPFFRDARAEMIICTYVAGDDGRLHWHEAVDEYQIILEGRLGFLEAATGQTRWFNAGDVSHVPAGACVRRLVPDGARTVTIKVPSRP
ncbi:hypothetical protein, partial [Roseibium sp.]